MFMRDEDCPAVTVGESAPCRWVPLSLMQDVDAGLTSSRDGSRVIVVLEVCPACRRYRTVSYVPVETTVPRDANGVQSTP